VTRRATARSTLLAGAVLALTALATATPAAARLHRTVLPPPELARSLSVDEFEFRLRASKVVVAAGPVRIRAYNRGQDDHNLVIVDRRGRPHHADLKPGENAVLTPVLTPGRYKLFCSLQAGTPQSHELLGMRFVLTVRAGATGVYS